MCNEADETLYDLKIDFLEDGGVNLEQSAGCGESPHYMTLHPVHIRYLAERTGLTRPTAPCPGPYPSARERRLRVVADLLADLAGEGGYREEIFARCGCGEGFLARLDAIVTIATEFATDNEAGESQAPIQASPPPAAPQPSTQCQQTLFCESAGDMQ